MDFYKNDQFVYSCHKKSKYFVVLHKYLSQLYDKIKFPNFPNLYFKKEINFSKLEDTRIALAKYLNEIIYKLPGLLKNPLFKNITENESYDNFQVVRPHIPSYEDIYASSGIKKESSHDKDDLNDLPNKKQAIPFQPSNSSNNIFYLEKLNSYHLPERVFMLEGEINEDIPPLFDLPNPIYLKKGDQVGVIFEEEDYYFIQNKNGKGEGYIPKKYFQLF